MLITDARDADYRLGVSRSGISCPAEYPKETK
ncbi:hypothetical protein QFZ82_007830 [Streptomyces sp. V4I23]|nr:hypothetical protein [Streptomyces sp. V4I23]